MNDIDNHAEFAKQVLRAIADLFQNHPKLRSIGHVDLLFPALNDADENRDKLDFASGTIEWLYRTGVVSGDLESNYFGKIINEAQLSSNSYSILRRPESPSEKLLSPMNRL